METIHITDYRSHHDVLTKPMTEKELTDNITKSGKISAKLVVDLNDLVNNDIDWLNDELSERITDSVAGLTDIEYTVAGRTTNNEVILKVTATVEFDNL